MTRTSAQIWQWAKAVVGNGRGASWGGARRPQTLAGGVESSGERDYQSGDDFRYIDWARCARHDELVSRDYAAPALLPTYLLVDGSASMGLGDGGKLRFALDLAAGLQAFAQAAGDPVQAFIGNGTSSTEIESFEEDFEPLGGATDLAALCRAAIAPELTPGVVVLVSDLLDPAGLEKCLVLLRRAGQQLFVLHVADPADAEPVVTGRVRLVGAASQGQLDVRIDQDDLADYRQRFRRWLEMTVRFCLEREVGYARAWTHEQATHVLERILAR